MDNDAKLYRDALMLALNFFQEPLSDCPVEEDWKLGEEGDYDCYHCPHYWYYHREDEDFEQKRRTREFTEKAVDCYFKAFTRKAKAYEKEKRKMRIMIDPGAYMPERAHATDAGLDLKTPEDFFIGPNSSHTIDTGVHVEIPTGCVGFLKSKSGLNVKRGIVSEGVIDEGYTGSICVKLYNHHPYMAHEFKAGEKISQLVILPVVIPDELEVVNELEDTERGDDGFGSTGA